MKKIFILTIILLSSLFSGALSSTEITNMVSKIKEERIGISLLKLEGTANPFILYVPKQKAKTEETNISVVLQPSEIVYSLKAILNHAAFIDKKWYKQGDSMGDYKIGYVSSSSVILKSANGDGNKVLKLKKKKKNFIKLNRGYR